MEIPLLPLKCENLMPADAVTFVNSIERGRRHLSQHPCTENNCTPAAKSAIIGKLFSGSGHEPEDSISALPQTCAAAYGKGSGSLL